MEFKLLRRENIVTSRWAGGKTHQVCIYPDTSLYSERNFLFRLSFAKSRLEKSDFTPLPDYDRAISLIEGKAELFLEDKNLEKSLEPFEVFYFDGGEKVTSQGKYTDFNLMTRKGKCRGTLDVINLDSESKKLNISSDEYICLFLPEEEGSLLINNEVRVSSLEGILITGDGPFKFKGHGRCFLATIKYGPSKEKIRQ